MTVPARCLPVGGHADPTERLSADDQATQREAQFLAHALLAQRLRAEGGVAIRTGVCAWCAARCEANSIYCDAECRTDHEAELRTLARQGRSR